MLDRLDKKPDPSASPSPEVDPRQQETMTGDWDGTRTRLREHGLEIDFKLAGFVEGTAAGGSFVLWYGEQTPPIF